MVVFNDGFVASFILCMQANVKGWRKGGEKEVKIIWNKRLTSFTNQMYVYTSFRRAPERPWTMTICSAATPPCATPTPWESTPRCTPHRLRLLPHLHHVSDRTFLPLMFRFYMYLQHSVERFWLNATVFSSKCRGACCPRITNIRPDKRAATWLVIGS